MHAWHSCACDHSRSTACLAVKTCWPIVCVEVLTCWSTACFAALCLPPGSEPLKSRKFEEKVEDQNIDEFEVTIKGNIVGTVRKIEGQKFESAEDQQ